MLKNYIREAKAFNQIPLAHFEGIKVFYGKGVHYLVLAISILLVAFLSVGFIALDKSYTFFIFLLGYAFAIANLTKAIGRLMLRNPVFIVEKRKIYYLKTNTWYAIADHQFREERIGRGASAITCICMFDWKGKRIFFEQNWLLDNVEAMKNQIQWIQLPAAQKQSILAKRKQR